jgi:peptidylprolyl isomerase
MRRQLPAFSFQPPAARCPHDSGFDDLPMIMRTLPLAVLVLLAACGSPERPALPPIPPPDDVAAPPPDSLKTASGISTKVLQPGTGSRRPRATDTVRVHYTGWTTDGKMFDSSVARGEPAEFALNGVIRGWTEGVQMMVEGEKRRFWIPEELAYQGKRDPYGMLVFDIELIDIR